MLKKIDHIGIVVNSLTQAAKFYKYLGIEPFYYEEVKSQKVKVAFLKIGESDIELLEPTSDDSSFAKFLLKQGEGIHHVCYEVEDLISVLKRLKEGGIKLINEEPVQGAHGKKVAFVHTQSTNGVLTELAQP